MPARRSGARLTTRYLTNTLLRLLTSSAEGMATAAEAAIRQLRPRRRRESGAWPRAERRGVHAVHHQRGDVHGHGRPRHARAGATAHHRHDYRDRSGRPGAAHAGRHGGDPERREERRSHHGVERGRPVHDAGAAARQIHAAADARGVRHRRADRHTAAVRRGLQRRHHHAERRRPHPVHHRLCRQRRRPDRQCREELGARRARHRVARRPRPRSAEPAADDAGRAGGPEHRLARRHQRRSGTRTSAGCCAAR